MTLRPATTRPPRPTVLADTGPDGTPQAMLLTPTCATVLDQGEAAGLICDLLAAVQPDRDSGGGDAGQAA